MSLFEIYFHDLNEEAQKRYLKFKRVSNPSELNLDVVPICIIERGDDEE